MKKKTVHRKVVHKKVVAKKVGFPKNYLLWIKGWMFVVMFALMLGIGAIVGNFLNQQMNQSTPTVAGAETEFDGSDTEFVIDNENY